MDRRIFAVSAVSLSVFALSGCESEPKPSATATLIDNDQVHQAMQSLESVIANVSSDAEDFDTKSWREVVPEPKDFS